jgi:hypothetical protein
MSAATIAQMQFVSDYGGSGVFKFTVDGVLKDLYCDQWEPNAMTGPYLAAVSTLADLTETYLGIHDSTNALQKYQQIAILNLIARADPSSAVAAVRAARHITDPDHTGLTPAAQALYDYALAQNPANFDLTGFRIYYREGTQEVTGFNDGFNLEIDTPEPSAFALFGSGIAAIAFFRRRRPS